MRMLLYARSKIKYITFNYLIVNYYELQFQLSDENNKWLVIEEFKNYIVYIHYIFIYVYIII